MVLDAVTLKISPRVGEQCRRSQPAVSFFFQSSSNFTRKNSKFLTYYGFLLKSPALNTVSMHFKVVLSLSVERRERSKCLLLSIRLR